MRLQSYTNWKCIRFQIKKRAKHPICTECASSEPIKSSRTRRSENRQEEEDKKKKRTNERTERATRTRELQVHFSCTLTFGKMFKNVSTSATIGFENISVCANARRRRNVNSSFVRYFFFRSVFHFFGCLPIQQKTGSAPTESAKCRRNNNRENPK